MDDARRARGLLDTSIVIRPSIDYNLSPFPWNGRFRPSRWPNWQSASRDGGPPAKDTTSRSVATGRGGLRRNSDRHSCLPGKARGRRLTPITCCVGRRMTCTRASVTTRTGTRPSGGKVPSGSPGPGTRPQRAMNQGSLPRRRRPDRYRPSCVLLLGDHVSTSHHTGRRAAMVKRPSMKSRGVPSGATRGAPIDHSRTG